MEHFPKLSLHKDTCSFSFCSWWLHIVFCIECSCVFHWSVLHVSRFDGKWSIMTIQQVEQHISVWCWASWSWLYSVFTGKLFWDLLSVPSWSCWCSSSLIWPDLTDIEYRYVRFMSRFMQELPPAHHVYSLALSLITVPVALFIAISVITINQVTIESSIQWKLTRSRVQNVFPHVSQKKVSPVWKWSFFGWTVPLRELAFMSTASKSWGRLLL